MLQSSCNDFIYREQLVNLQRTEMNLQRSEIERVHTCSLSFCDNYCLLWHAMKPSNTKLYRFYNASLEFKPFPKPHNVSVNCRDSLVTAGFRGIHTSDFKSWQVNQFSMHAYVWWSLPNLHNYPELYVHIQSACMGTSYGNVLHSTFWAIFLNSDISTWYLVYF